MMAGGKAAVCREGMWIGGPEASRVGKASVSVENWKGDSGWTTLCGVRSGRAEHRLVDGDRIGALGDCG